MAPDPPQATRPRANSNPAIRLGQRTTHTSLGSMQNPPKCTNEVGHINMMTAATYTTMPTIRHAAPRPTVPPSASAAMTIAGTPTTTSRIQLNIGRPAVNPTSGAPHMPSPASHDATTAHPAANQDNTRTCLRIQRSCPTSCPTTRPYRMIADACDRGLTVPPPSYPASPHHSGARQGAGK